MRTVENEILHARHVVANAAGAVAQVAAQIARALAWQPEPDQGPAFKSEIETAICALRRAEDQLFEARVRMGLALEAHERANDAAQAGGEVGAEG